MGNVHDYSFFSSHLLLSPRSRSVSQASPAEPDQGLASLEVHQLVCWKSINYVRQFALSKSNRRYTTASAAAVEEDAATELLILLLLLLCEKKTLLPEVASAVNNFPSFPPSSPLHQILHFRLGLFAFSIAVFRPTSHQATADGIVWRPVVRASLLFPWRVCLSLAPIYPYSQSIYIRRHVRRVQPQ